MSLQVCDPDVPGLCGIYQKCHISERNASLFNCQHDSIFPIQDAYVYVLYAIFPILIGLAIIGGVGGIHSNHTQVESIRVQYCSWDSTTTMRSPHKYPTAS